jgi:hypothetical protein
MTDDPSSDLALEVAPLIPSAKELSHAEAVELAPLVLRAREKSKGSVGRNVELERRSATGGGETGGDGTPPAGPNVLTAGLLMALVWMSKLNVTVMQRATQAQLLEWLQRKWRILSVPADKSWSVAFQGVQRKRM